MSREMSVSRILSAPSVNSEEAAIYLVRSLLIESRPAEPVNGELPNLLFHRKGFTAPSCHHEARQVASEAIAQTPLVTFHLWGMDDPILSIVSVALSLGLNSRILDFMPGRR